jgi:hypothetical protein
VSFNAHSAVYGLGMVLLILEVGAVAGLFARNAATGSRYTALFVTVQLLITYLIYPLGCKVLFSTFDCITVDGIRYLRSDHDIECVSAAHKSAEAFSACMVSCCLECRICSKGT